MPQRDRAEGEKVPRPGESPLLDLVLETASEGVCAFLPTDKGLRFPLWSPRMAALTGFSHGAISQLRADGPQLWVDLDEKARALQQAAALGVGSGVGCDTWRVRRADGRERTFGVALRRPDRQCLDPAASLALVTDITEQQETALVLAHREAILEAVTFWSRSFLRSGSSDGSFSVLLKRLGEAADVSRVYVFRNDRSPDGELLTSQRLEWVAQGIAAQADNPELQRLPLRAAGFSRWADILGGGELVHGPVDTFPDSERAVLDAQHIRSLCVAPIFEHDRWWGFIGLDDCKTRRTWAPAERDALRTAADLFGAALRRYEDRAALDQAYNLLEERVEKRTAELSQVNEQLKREIARRELAEGELRRMAVTDELTGVYNRRGFFAAARTALRMAARDRRGVMLLFADLDGLKPINDDVGHAAGDQALQDAADVLNAVFRGADVIARLGGDEFAVLMAVDAASDAEPLVRQRLAERLAELNGQPDRRYTLSFSIGVLTRGPGEATDIDALLAEADARMYEAKRAKGTHKPRQALES